jgi:uncharacterized OB-fold protein
MSKKIIPVREGLWVNSINPAEKPQLIGSRCGDCGEIFFPKRLKGICLNCQKTKLEDILLSRRGKIYSFTIVMQSRPQPAPYKGPVPYALAWVELPEGVRFETLLTDCDFDRLKVGMDVELVIEKLHDNDDGNEVLSYKFRPVDG